MPSSNFKLWPLLLHVLALGYAGNALAEPSAPATLPTGEDAGLRHAMQSGAGWTARAFDPVPLEVSVDGGRGPVVLPLAKMPPVSSGFGRRADPIRGGVRMHNGIDLPSAQGTPVRATMSGRVSSSGWSGGFGNLIEIDHGNGLVTRYGHLSSRLVEKGDNVPVGMIIGLVGSTGRSTGNHLHYEVRYSGRSVNPLNQMQAALPSDGDTHIAAYLPPEFPSAKHFPIWSDSSAPNQLPVATLPSNDLQNNRSRTQPMNSKVK